MGELKSGRVLDGNRDERQLTGINEDDGGGDGDGGWCFVSI